MRKCHKASIAYRVPAPGMVQETSEGARRRRAAPSTAPTTLDVDEATGEREASGRRRGYFNVCIMSAQCFSRAASYDSIGFPALSHGLKSYVFARGVYNNRPQARYGGWHAGAGAMQSVWAHVPPRTHPEASAGVRAGQHQQAASVQHRQAAAQWAGLRRPRAGTTPVPSCRRFDSRTRTFRHIVMSSVHAPGSI
jgi:hypothetical protein